MLKNFLLLSAAILIGVAPASAPARPGSGTGMPQEPKPPATIYVKPAPESTQKLYAVDCAMCHGINGNGKTDLATGMNLTLGDWTDPKTLANKTDQELFNAIRNGKDKMPAEGAARANDDDVRNLILYIRNLSKSQPATPAN